MLIKKLLTLFVLLLLCSAAVMARISKMVTEDGRLEFTVPAAPWTLSLPKGEIAIQQQQIKPNKQEGYFSMVDKKTYLFISFFIEPVRDCKDSETCRDMILNLGNPSWENPQNLVKSRIDDISCFEFLIPSFRGKPVKQQNLYAEFVKDGYWVDMHISMPLYDPKDHDLFEQFVKSVRFDPKASVTKGN